MVYLQLSIYLKGYDDTSSHTEHILFANTLQFYPNAANYSDGEVLFRTHPKGWGGFPLLQTFLSLALHGTAIVSGLLDAIELNSRDISKGSLSRCINCQKMKMWDMNILHPDAVDMIIPCLLRCCHGLMERFLSLQIKMEFKMWSWISQIYLLTNNVPACALSKFLETVNYPKHNTQGKASDYLF